MKTDQQIKDSRLFSSLALVVIIGLILYLWCQQQGRDFADVVDYPVNHSEIKR